MYENEVKLPDADPKKAKRERFCTWLSNIFPNSDTDIVAVLQDC